MDKDAEDKSSVGNRQRLTQTAPISATHHGTSSSSASYHGGYAAAISSPTGTNNNGFSASSGSAGGTGVGTGTATISGKLVDIQECLFEFCNYISLLGEGTIPAGTSIYSEKEISRIFDKMHKGFLNVDDWNVRMQALRLLQSLALGDAMEFESEFLQQCRSHIDILVAQVSDLRSVLSKEACRTVAILALRMGPAFAALADHFVPALLKLTVVKIKTMSSAADRCIRIIISVSSGGSPRLISVFTEHSQSKSPLLRKVSYEYLCLLAALWNTDVLQKHISSLRTAVKTGVGDADAAVRRSARHLYWILQRNAAFQRQMDALSEALDQGTIA